MDLSAFKVKEAYLQKSKDCFFTKKIINTIPDCGLLAEDSAAKLKRSQLNVCTVYAYCVQCTLSPPVAETCARLDGNFYQQLTTTVTSGANGMVRVTVCYVTAS